MTSQHQQKPGPRLRAAVLDWAGTVVDFGCHAPVAAVMAAFASHGVTITEAQARAPMGLAKWQHLRAIADQPSVAAAWTARFGGAATDAEIDALYNRFLPLQTAIVSQHAQLIPGVTEAVAAMRARGMKIGTTTGYPRAVIDAVASRAAAQGYVPDCIIAAGETVQGRPSPFPVWQALERLGVYPAHAAVKIGDTVADIEEGRNGGLWTVGVALSGNEAGMSLAAWQALAASEKARLRQAAVARLTQAGAHYVIDTIADIVPVLDDIERHMAAA